jgi:hypothetical protein
MEISLLNYLWPSDACDNCYRCRPNRRHSLNIWHSDDHTTWYILIIKANEMHYFSALFGKELYVFRTDLLSIIRSLNSVFTAIGICHASFVDCLLARSGREILTTACVFIGKIYINTELTTTAKEMLLKLHNSREWLLRTMMLERKGKEAVCNRQSFSMIPHLPPPTLFLIRNDSRCCRLHLKRSHHSRDYTARQKL